ncbi:MAG: arginine--tRNA ligase [Clostridia bacterium]|nr:arginine--tRNA ligase [Clostridia bacterium]
MDYKQLIAQNIKIEGFEAEDVYSFIEVPPTKEVGDYALPCFKFSRALRKAPPMIAKDLAESFPKVEGISSVEAVGGYLNFKLDRSGFIGGVLQRVLGEGELYGSSKIGEGKTVCLDYSSVNIAKPFHIGHLSTTVIGAALYRIYKFLGYNTVGINHLGDYGTQFGKLIYAFKTWGDRAVVDQKGLEELTRLYVLYHEVAEKTPEIDDIARSYFKKIEDGDKECVELFEYFKAITLKEIDKIYKLLDVQFDSYAGESFYNDKMQPVVDELKEKGLLVESQGAQVVDLEEYGMPPCIILRSDGASLYATRDMAAAYYRKNTYNFDKCLYVVAYQQNLHFQQIFKVLELLGKPWAKDMVHVAYGMVSLESGSMSTRKGKVVLLEDVLSRCIQKALDIIEEKNPNLENKHETAKQVGVGAAVFGMLYNNKIKDVVFSYDKVLNFDGETAPYCQYTVARCNSVIARARDINAAYDLSRIDVNEQEFAVCSLLQTFPDVVLSAAEKYEPCYITRFAVDLAKAFNKFYFDCKIITDDDNLTAYRVAITKCARQALKTALKLIGVGTPEKM